MECLKNMGKIKKILDVIVRILEIVIFCAIIFGIVLLTVVSVKYTIKLNKYIKEDAKWNIKVANHSYYTESYTEIDLSEYGFDDTVIIFTDHNCTDRGILKSEIIEIISIQD